MREVGLMHCACMLLPLCQAVGAGLVLLCMSVRLKDSGERGSEQGGVACKSSGLLPAIEAMFFTFYFFYFPSIFFFV